MTSVEKRRSSRKNGGHRKHSDGGFSDTSSGGSFLDETDREVRSLTDKAFRSLCIGDEAVYNDSDLGPASPCIQRDRQRAFSQGGREKAKNEEVKRAAHESFSEMVRQYEEDWINEGMYRAEMDRNSQWEGRGDGTHDKVSATFRDCFMEMNQENRSPGEDATGYCSNGATDLSLQHRRSRSRVSSLIRAFNTEEGVVMDDQLREWNNETQWNRPGLMNMPSYQQNFTNGHVPIVGQYSSQNNSVYSTEAGAHINTALSLMGMSHYNQNMMTQENCNTNFFMHSEFSPFKVWADHNRSQQQEVSRFMHYSECPKWGKTPMYKERSLEQQMNGFSMFQERSRRHHRAMTTTVAPNHHLQSISKARFQKASSLEKRCESEQAVYHPHTTKTMSLGTKKLQSQRPSTASPTVEMPKHFQETIYSVKGLHQQIKIMSEINSDRQMKDSRQKAICNDTLCAVKTEGHIASYGINDVLKTAQLLSSPVSQAEPEESRRDPVSSQLVEHSPVRAESRGGTPDMRMPSYRSRASNLLFNLKDNRKRVKSTYSPAKFKGIETTEKSIEVPFRESKDIVIDIPDIQESSWMETSSHHNVKPYHSPSHLSPQIISQPDPGHISDHKAALRQDESEQTEQSKAQQSVYGGHSKEDNLQKINFIKEEQVQTATTDKIVSDKIKLEQDERKEQKMEQVRGKENDRTSEKQTALTQVGKEETNYLKVQAEVMTSVQSESVRAIQGDLKDLKAKEGTLESVQKDNTDILDVEARQIIEKEGEKIQKAKTKDFTAMQISTEKVQLQTKTAHVSAKMEEEMTKDEQSDKKSDKESTVNDQPQEERNNAKEKYSIARQVELAKVELTNVELAKVALIKYQHIKERSSKPPAKPLQHQVKSDPNKVERVKTELAKAKAELSKMKEKTKGEQREKVGCTIITKECGNNKDVSADVTDIQLTAQCNSSQDQHADENYHALREKYCFNNLVLQNMTPGGNSSSNGGNVTSSALSFDVTKDNNDKSNIKNTTLNCESDNKDNLNFNKANGSLYVYSESSKEFKLSQEDSLPACTDKNIIGDIANKGKTDNVKNKDLTHPDSTCTVPRQTDSESVQNPERKAKSEHLKATSQREKSQTKQQILTSKVKAHAEKEISALIEGFALREALTHKTSTKPLPDCPLKQKPYEVAKGHEIPTSSNTTTKQQVTSSGLEGPEVYTSEEMSNKMINQFQERTPQEPTKSNNLSPETTAPEMKTTAGQSENPDQQACNQKIKSPKQSYDQESKDPKENMVLQCSENNKKVTFESFSPKSDSPVQNIKSSSSPGKQGVLLKDFVFGQVNNSVAEDSLQIMGISVTEVKVNNEHKVVNAEHSKDSSSEHDTYFQDTGLEMSKKSECLIQIGTANTRENHPIEKKTIHDACVNFENEETIEKSVQENWTEKIESSPLPCSITSVEPKSKIQVKETLPACDVTPSNSINKITDEPCLLHYKQDAMVAEMEERYTLETFDLTKNCDKDQEKIKIGESDPQLKEEAAKGKTSGLNWIEHSQMAHAVIQSATPSLEEDVTQAINPSADSIKDKSTLLVEENKYDSTTMYLNKIESKNTSLKLQEASKGIMNQVDDIYKDNTVVPVKPAAMVACPFVTAVEELQHNIPSSASENMRDHKAKQPELKSIEEQVQQKLEDKLSVQDVLASVKKLADSMKQMEQLNSINTAREDMKTDTAQTLGTISHKQGSEGDYFQVEGIWEGPGRNNNIQRDVSEVPKGVEHSERSSNESGLDSQGESMRKHKRAGIPKKSTLKQTECPSELLSGEKMVVAQTVDMEKRQSEFRSREGRNSRNSQLTREEPEIKSKPKVRTSTIPEISALADYARLKVIVSEDRENTNPEFPPHKKEGFFPLIQSRHSRRPVFSVDTQEHPVNKKIDPKKMEVINNANKQPRAVVFPITEKEHQRTGMFKLGEKEKTEKTLYDIKDQEGFVGKQQDLPQKKMMHGSHNETKVDRQEVPELSRKIVGQFNKEEMLSSSINKPRESLQLQQNVSEIPSPDDKIKHLMLMENNSSTKRTLESVCQDGTSKSSNNTNKNTSEIKFEPSRKAILEIHPEGANAKQSRDAKDQPEGACKRLEETIAGEENAKLDERSAFLSEERKRAQREAARWEKLKETAQRMEEERKAKQTKRWNPTEDDKKTPGERRVKQRQVEKTAQEEEEMGAFLIEQQRLTKRIEQRNLAEEIRLQTFQKYRDEEQRRVKQKSVPKTACENKEVTGPSETQIVGEKLREKQLNGSEKVRAPQLLQKEDDFAAKREENYVAHREKVSTSEEEENREALLMDALQYYTITSTHKKPNERRKDSPPTLQQENPLSVPSERSGSQRKLHGPQAQPAPSLPRSTTSSPALGGKPLMFRVKDNTKGSSFKSVKPCFHKNLVEESRVGSPMEWRAEKREDEREIMRRNTRTPINSKLVTGVNRLAPFKESHISQPVPSLNDNSTFLPHHRPFCRRNIALDEEDSRSVVSNMSEEVQSFANSVVDMTEFKGLCDSDRPVSVCSFGSDMSRLGKPPAVPPKSDQALRKAQRLTTRRIRKEVTQNTSTNPVGKSQRETTSRPASTSSEEVWSSNHHAVASPHFSPPVSLTHTPTFGPSLLSTHTEKQHSRLPLHTPPHAAIPAISPHATATEPHLHYPDAMPHPVSLLTPSPISQAFPSAHSATPVPLPAASPAVITSTSPNTTPPVHSFIFPHVTTPVPRQASTPGVTSPTSNSIASPHSTAFSKHQVVSPHVPSPSCKPPYAAAPASRSTASPHINALLNHPSSTVHATASVAHPFPYMPAIVSHPVATPHAPNSFPMSSPNVAAQMTHPALASKNVQYVPSSPPTLHYATQPAPVTQYHVESSYPQSYPLTQRKVLQDLGSGQYFLVDAPIEVKTKTFLDPETGKYVLLNVRESAQNIFRPHLQPVLTQPVFPQLNFQPQPQLEQQHFSQDSSAEKTFSLQTGYQSHPQFYTPPLTPSMSSQRSSSGVSVQNEANFKDNYITSRTNEIGGKFHSQRYSPEQTPYMDTVNDTKKTQKTHESFSDCETNKQLAGGLFENDNSVYSRCQPCDIISMSELDDFMDMSDW
ncbi:cardiac-enriched FHL2-interacting protein [Stigmatopora nigra]